MTAAVILTLPANLQPPTIDRAMDKSAKKFFQQILETPSPSGYEQPVQEIVRKYVADFADDVRTDLHGNVIAVRESEGAAPRDVRRPRRPDRLDRHAHQRERLHLHQSRSAAGIRSSSSASG